MEILTILLMALFFVLPLSLFYWRRRKRSDSHQPDVADPSALEEAENAARSANFREDLKAQGYKIIAKYPIINGFSEDYMVKIVEECSRQGIAVVYEKAPTMSGLGFASGMMGVYYLYGKESEIDKIEPVLKSKFSLGD